MTEQFEQYITQAESIAAQKNMTVETVLSSWEGKVAGLDGIVEYYKKKNGNAIPPPPAIPLPDNATTQNQTQITDVTKQMLEKLSLPAPNGYGVPIAQVMELFWANYGTVRDQLGLQGQELENQCVLFTQVKIRDQKTGGAEGDYSFIVLYTTGPYQQMKEDMEQIPGAEPGRKRKIKTQVWRNEIFGQFTRHAEGVDDVTFLGGVTAWDQEGAMAMKDLKTGHQYTGKFEGRAKNSYFALNLNKKAEFEDKGEVDLNLDTFKTQLMELAYKTEAVVTPTQVDQVELKGRGRTLIVDGAVARAFTSSTKGGGKIGTLKLVDATMEIQAEPKAAFVKFWQGASEIYKYGEGSRIMAVCYASKGNDPEYGINLNCRGLIPIMTIPGKPPTESQMPAYRPPVE